MKQVTIKKGDIFLFKYIEDLNVMALCLEPQKEIQEWMVFWYNNQAGPTLFKGASEFEESCRL